MAVFAWAALLVGVAGRVALSPPRAQTVFPIYTAAGERWLGRQPLYDYTPTAGLDVYRNPPGFAAVVAPLTLLPHKPAAVLWRVASAAVFLVALVRFRRAVLPELSPTRTALLYGLAVPVALPAVNNGQVNLLIAAAGLGGAAAAVRRNWWEAAGWFSLGGWLKVYPLAVGLLAGLLAPRTLLPRLLAVTAAGFAVPFLLADPAYVWDQSHAFLTSQAADDRTYAELPRVQRDWTIVPRAWLGWVSPPAVTKGVSLLAAGGAVGLVLGLARRTTDPAGRFALAVVVGTGWMTLFGPATEAHTYAVWGGAAAALAVAPAGRSRAVAGLAVAGYALLAAAVLRAVFPQDWKFTALGPQPVGAALLTAAAVLHTIRRPRPPAVVGDRPHVFAARVSVVAAAAESPEHRAGLPSAGVGRATAV